MATSKSSSKKSTSRSGTSTSRSGSKTTGTKSGARKTPTGSTGRATTQRSGSTASRTASRSPRSETSMAGTRSRSTTNRGGTQSHSNTPTRSSSNRGNMYRDETDYGYRRGQRYEDDYGRRPDRRYEYGDDYYRNQWDRPGTESSRYRDRGGMNYGNDWGAGRNQERYDERNQQWRGYPQNWGPEQRQGRSNYGSDWYSGGYGGRTSRRSTWGEPYSQDYYTENAWDRQRSQPWTRTDDQMEKNDDYRQARSSTGRMFSRPTGKNDEGLRKLLTDQLKDMYWAEKALTKELPKLVEKATSYELKNALEDHLYETEGHVRQLEEIFSLIGEKASAKKCDAMNGLIKEAHEITKDMDEGSVRDAGIICAAQKTEHYEIATYGCLSTYAEILGERQVVGIFEDILHEEKRADKTLTQVAQSINWEAAEEGEETEEEEEEEEESEEESEEEEDEEEDDNYTEIKGTSNVSELTAIES